MAYSTANPPSLIQSFAGGGGLWLYRSTDAIAAVDAIDYITNASALGMVNGDPVFIIDTTNGLTSIGKVTLDSDGNGTLTALTAFP